VADVVVCGAVVVVALVRAVLLAHPAAHISVTDIATTSARSCTRSLERTCAS
jgi:hypothetical protein